MDERAARGLRIAAISKLPKNGAGWVVPSQTGNGDTNIVNPNEQRCTCPDHLVRQMKCNHILAVEYTIQREMMCDGADVGPPALSYNPLSGTNAARER